MVRHNRGEQRVTAGPTCKLRGKSEGAGNTGQPGVNQAGSKAKMILLRLEGETTVEDAVRAFGYLTRTSRVGVLGNQS